MKRKLFSLFLFLAILFSLATPAFAAQTVTVDPINVMVGGKDFLPTDVNGKDVPVFAYNGTTYAPLRALAEAYGLSVGYNASRPTAYMWPENPGNLNLSQRSFLYEFCRNCSQPPILPQL